MAPRPEAIEGYQRFDSRGNPTLKVDVITKGNRVSALVPSGASTGKLEAHELRDGGRAYRGMGVLSAVEKVREVESTIKDIDVLDQRLVDRTLIKLAGKNKEDLGANTTLAISMAVARAAAEAKGVELFQHIADLYGIKKTNLLPTPMMNILNGGKHAKNNLEFQEFMIVPIGADSFGEAMRMGSEIHRTLGILTKASGVGDEGGFSPSFFDSREGKANIEKALSYLQKAIRSSGYKPGKDIAIALDPAASEFYVGGAYRLNMYKFGSKHMVDFYEELIDRYPIISIEDGMAENDDEGWRLLTERLGNRIQLVGDDLFVTNPRVFRDRGINREVANAILIKPNQIGTLTETLQVMKQAKRYGYKTIVSHRSGETEDTFISDLVMGTGAGQIKTGALARGERTAKYNRLLDIEEIHLPYLQITPQFKGGEVF